MATVVQVDGIPPFSEFADDAAYDGAGEESDAGEDDALAMLMVSYVQTFFEDARIVVDIGARTGVAERDYLAVVSDPEVARHIDLQNLSYLHGSFSCLVRVAMAYPQTSVCQLSSWAYSDYFSQFEKLTKAAAGGRDEIELSDLDNVLPLIKAGAKGVLIPRDEVAARDAIQHHYDQTLSDESPEDEKRHHYKEMIREAERLLLHDSRGFFASDALFQKGYAQFQLEKYEESISTFNGFLDRFPFHTSSEGAREWISKGEERLRTAPS